MHKREQQFMNNIRRYMHERNVKTQNTLCNIVLLCILWAIAFSVSPAFGQDTDQEEKILFYGSQIDIDTTGRVYVTETIKVRSLAQDIRHGIYRSIPTKYKGRFMEEVVVPLEVTRVLRDGNPEHYSIKEANNGSSIYIGDEYQDLPAGDYTYTIAYTVDRQVGFFDGYDEFYWNVTGSGWKLGIDSVYAVVNLPPGATILKEKISAYSGASGETGCDCKFLPVSGTSAAFYTTEPLYAYEGLTVAVPFENGLITPPSQDEMIDRMIADNYPAVIALIGLAIVLTYYFVAWLLVGVDPRGRTIVPSFEPPQNLAPYELRYLKKMKFDNKAMVAALVGMAQNGHLTIEETGKENYTLRRSENPDHVPTAIEKTILSRLFTNTSSITLNNTYNPAFGQALDHLKQHLKKNFNNSAFRLNRPWIVIGILMSTAAVVYSAIQHPNDNSLPGLFMLVWLSGWTFGCYFLVKTVVTSFRERKHAKGIGLLVFAVPFLAGEIFGIGVLTSVFNFYVYISIFLLVLINIVFFGLLKAPTLHGRRLLDEIDGFSRFIRTAEMPRMQSLSTSPAMDLSLFQRYLPYALALDLQTEWANHFEDQLTAPEQATHFRWYTGMSASHSLGQFSSSFNHSFSSTISSSSTPPSSSSGSGGGGSSGGGGGGGGGGGW